MARHELAAFGAAGGEAAQVYARDRRLAADAPLVYLPPGAAEALRSDCRAGHLICPVPGCESPEYTTVSGDRRHHFRHLGPGGHGRETWFHFLGKQIVAEWLRTTHPEATVAIEEAVEDKQRPDVLAEFPDGHRFGIEIQYALITPEEWRARHERYQANGITDLWLFGHAPPHFKLHQAEWLNDLLRMSPVLRTVAQADMRVRFINPDEKTIASQLIETARHGLWRDGLEVAVDDLADCRIDSDRLVTPTDLRERMAKKQRILAEKREAEEAERRAKHENERAARRASWALGQKQRLLNEWEEFKPGFLHRLSLDAVPKIVEREIKGDRCIFKHPAHWHAILFEQVIQGRVGESFSFKRAAAPFAALQPRHTDRVWMGMRGYLFYLRRHGYLWLDNDWSYIENVVVLADLATPPSQALRAFATSDPSGLRIASEGDHLVVCSWKGTPLQPLRPLRDGDSVPPRSDFVEEAENHAVEFNAAPPSLTMREPEIRPDWFVVDVDGKTYESPEFQTRYRELCRDHPGEQRVYLRIKYQPGDHRFFTGMRSIEKAEHVDGSAELRQAITALLPMSRSATGL